MYAPHYRLRLIFIVVFSFLVSLLCAYLIRAQTLLETCDQFGTIETVRFRNPLNDERYTLSGSLASELENWEIPGANDDNWIGYERGGWLIAPDDIYLSLTVTTEYTNESIYSRRKIIFYSNENYPDLLLPMAFEGIRPYADSNGNHYGIHPCAAWIVQKSDIDRWLLEIARSVG